ncbi:MAG: hypothetical protein E2O53_00490 [Gammaproteobacteria bacterium]|nr:MAG: hypothetical protein E2O53_00490 [Gammaproteobacteria bacterium]
MNYKKRIAILIILIVSLLAWFWLGSRYPVIDEKAAMAGEAVMADVLSFEAHFPVDAAVPMWRKIVHSTLNWLLTNRQGMTFGVLLATLVLTLLQLRRRLSSFRSVFRDILKGVLIGAPLGVCVNCAAPIAYGMHQQGMRKGTSLATMFASPTLNIIVLVMTFSLLPMYMAVTKLVATLVFLLLALPLLVRFADRDSTLADPVPALQADSCAVLPVGPEPWSVALRGLTGDLWRNFLFIAVRTVPLMFLAGLLGSAMANLIPFESLSSWQVSFAAMALVGLLGTFAPVPIAFDVVVVQALLVAGLPPEFAMVLLFTLGVFSIYPLMLVANMLSWRFSGKLFLTVALFGVATGYFAGGWEDYQAGREARMFEQHFSHRNQPGMNPANAAGSGEGGREAKTRSSRALPAEAAGVVYSQDGVSLSAVAYRTRSPAGSMPFKHQPGNKLGLFNPEPLALDYMLPFSQGRGIAAGDFNGDGWPDLAVADNRGVRLYRNSAGIRFEPVQLDIPRLQQANVLLVALVDLDNDGCLDLFAGTFGDDDFIVAGDCDGFKQARVVALPHLEGLMTQAAAFADIDQDGDLDILKGNWFFLIPRMAPAHRATNYIALNQGNLGFAQQPLQEIVGETLAVYWSDLNQDGHVDMIIGNDYMEPDIFYEGTSAGRFRQLSAGGPVPVSTLATMSIDAADIDNDLDLDLFLSGKVNDFSMRREQGNQPVGIRERKAFVIQRRKDFQRRYCELFESSDVREACGKRFVLSDLLRRSNMDGCLDLETVRQRDECMITLRIKKSLIRRDWTFCPQIPAGAFPVHRQLCNAYAAYDAVAQPKILGDKYLDQGAIDQAMQGNVLLVRQSDGRYTEQAKALGVFDAFWAWNARFADLDLDEWQDLYVTNGWWLETSMYSNKFFHNQAGQGFEAREQEFGLVNLRKQHAFVYLDFDRDGDLDIISRSLDGEFDVFINHVQEERHSISFEFRDTLGNHFGIGNRITLFYGENDERHQLREIKAGGGFVSFDPPVAHFGLGPYERINRLVVDWSDGSASTIVQPLEAGHNYIISRER